jgi:hypothetical protein
MLRLVMRRLLSGLTAATLLVHALVGCCRHYEFCHTSGEPAECCESLADGCCHDEHAADCHHDERPFAPCDCKLQCMKLCVSLPPEKTLVAAGKSAPYIAIVPNVSATAVIQPSAGAFRESIRTSRASEPPLRLHLLHQIILV